MLLVVDVLEEAALDDDRHDRKPEAGSGDAQPEIAGPFLGDGINDIGAEHVEGAMREVDDAQDAEDQRQAGGDDEQVHRLREGIHELDEGEGRVGQQSRQPRIAQVLLHELDQGVHGRAPSAVSGKEETRPDGRPAAFRDCRYSSMTAGMKVTGSITR